MGPFSFAVLSVGLNILRWMLWLMAGLLLVMTIKQKLTGDPELRLGPQVGAICAFVLAGYVSAWAGRRIANLLAILMNKSDT